MNIVRSLDSVKSNKNLKDGRMDEGVQKHHGEKENEYIRVKKIIIIVIIEDECTKNSFLDCLLTLEMADEKLKVAESRPLIRK